MVIFFFASKIYILFCIFAYLISNGCSISQLEAYLTIYSYWGNKERGRNPFQTYREKIGSTK